MAEGNGAFGLESRVGRLEGQQTAVLTTLTRIETKLDETRDRIGELAVTVARRTSARDLVEQLVEKSNPGTRAQPVEKKGLFESFSDAVDAGHVVVFLVAVAMFAFSFFSKPGKEDMKAIIHSELQAIAGTSGAAAK